MSVWGATFSASTLEAVQENASLVGMTINSEVKQQLEGDGQKVLNTQTATGMKWSGEAPTAFYGFPLYGTSLKL